jgi:hypothetical protein
MKCMDCSKHGMVWCAMGDTILKSELVCQASANRPVITGATKAVVAATEAPAWCPFKHKKVDNGNS